MLKKTPSLKRQTQFANDRIKHATAALAGVVFEFKRGGVPWQSADNFRGWHYRLPGKEWTGPWRSRRSAVNSALDQLERAS